ncbi:MAG: sodium:calcium antiporter, partial [Exilibacterium sp.]
CILGVSSVTVPLGTTGAPFLGDVVVMGASTLLVLLFAWSGRGVSRVEGGSLLALYGAYVIWLS